MKEKTLELKKETNYQRKVLCVKDSLWVGSQDALKHTILK